MKIPRIRDMFRQGKFKRAKIDHAIPGRRTSVDHLQAIVDRAAGAGRDFCLDIGAGNLRDDGFTTVDVDPATNPDIVLDIRAIFAGSDVYRGMRKDYPDIDRIAGGYLLIRLHHVIEHIEWIYSRAMFQWLYSILGSGGILYIVTPNLEYSAKLYVQNLQRLEQKRLPAFPRAEHPDFTSPSKGYDVTRWMNFKMYSGASWGDYHHAAFDRYWLLNMLQEVGFTDIQYSDESTLYAVGSKPSGSSSGVDSAVRNIISEWEDRSRSGEAGR